MNIDKADLEEFKEIILKALKDMEERMNKKFDAIINKKD
jgi:hypothetical protein